MFYAKIYAGVYYPVSCQGNPTAFEIPEELGVQIKELFNNARLLTENLEVIDATEEIQQKMSVERSADPGTKDMRDKLRDMSEATAKAVEAKAVSEMAEWKEGQL